MPVITGKLADEEISKIKAIDDLDAAVNTFPYTRLSADDFERLNYALFKISAPTGQTRDWDDAGLMLRGADAGRDVILLRRGSTMAIPMRAGPTSARSSTPSRSTTALSGLLAARTCCRLSLPANRPRTGMFVVLYANGAPEEIRTPDPQIRSFQALVSLGFLRFGLTAVFWLGWSRYPLFIG